MVHMICGKTLRDGISNETICEMTSVEKIEESLREQRLRWFEHIEKKWMMKKSSNSNRKFGSHRLTKRWKENIEKDMLDKGLKKVMLKTVLYGGSAAKTYQPPLARKTNWFQ